MRQCIDIWKASGPFVVGRALFVSEALGAVSLGLREAFLLNAAHIRVPVQACMAVGALRGLEPPDLGMPLGRVPLKGAS